MDTRAKILAADSARPDFARPLAVVTGYFDVLRAEHVRQLNRIRQETGAATLVAVVLPREGALLSQRARAELVAGLRVVDYVLTAAPNCDADAKVHLEADDDRRSGELREHVRHRTISR